MNTNKELCELHNPKHRGSYTQAIKIINQNNHFDTGISFTMFDFSRRKKAVEELI
jgi:hypothetical protein